ncbi:hypothetical protein FRB90_002742 [Tulasnella sp. 427]|nr:hypothetical protein FRB90_002742 [Tulasnella sp. 427]
MWRFPGIPSHLPERPPASVRGVVELRPSGNSVKAKWVKIELRKIETLPGGGQSNTYADLVGESPVILWQAKNEWDEIRSQDLSFQIRVPESIPPSLALERSAGIKYELVASMQTKGKKGLLRRESTVEVNASCPIVIDKHELHSAWPMYARPESRSKTLDGYTLTVNRTHQAYGPGDRIAVQTLVKNDTPQVNQVRYYEFSLREHAMYKPAGIQNGTRKMMTQPQTRTRAIVEQRIPITMASPLHPGMQAKAELSLQVPFNQTTTTVSFAHRIEVQFVIHVRAVLATGLQLYLDLPITMSNWTRSQSIDVVRRIGPAGTFSNPGGAPGPVTTPPAGYEQHPMANPAQSPPGQPQMGWPPNGATDPNHFNSRPPGASPPNVMGPSPQSDFVGGWAAQSPPMTAPPMAQTMSGLQQQPPHQDFPNEFGAIPAGSAQRPMTFAGVPNGFTPQAQPPFQAPPANMPPPPPANTGPSPVNGMSGMNANNASEEVRAEDPLPRRRPVTGGSVGPTQRFTIVNLSAADQVDSPGGYPFPPPPAPSASKYMSAEEEKRRLREAMDRVDRPGGQQVAARREPTPPPPVPSASSSAPVAQPKVFLSAEEEKARLRQQHELYDAARTRAEQLQRAAAQEAVTGGSSSSDFQEQGSSTRTPPPAIGGSSSSQPTGQWLTAAEEKEQARRFREAQEAAEKSQRLGYTATSPTAGSSINTPNVWGANRPTSSGSGAPAAGMSAGKALYQNAMASMGRQSTMGPANGGFNYPSAAEEKEALRYKRAMEAAGRTQVDAYGNEAAPLPYEALFPSGPSAPATVPILPLNLTRSRSPPQQEQDQYVAAASSSATSPPPPPPPPAEGRPLNAWEEKERMRQMYAAQDAAARQPGELVVDGAPLVPPALQGRLNSSSTPAPPPPPTPPSAPASTQPPQLTAAQEKAMLRARYAAEDAAQNGVGSPPLPPPPRSATNSTLPPLPPPSVNHGSPPPPDFSPTERGMPSPPSFSSIAKPMTAAEEKAQLRAKYASEDAGGSSASSPPSSYFSRPPPPIPNGHTTPGVDEDEGKPEYLRRDPTISRGKRRATDDIPPPPPLPQKPPAEYYMQSNDPHVSAAGTPTSGSNGSFIDVRPFSPFSLDYETLGAAPPRPPLPPKPLS